MPDLLFISDIPKVEQIREMLQPLLKLEISVRTCPEAAPEDISGHQPAIICIQERLAGTTAGEIAKQIRTARTALENSPPLFVLLREGNAATGPAEHYFEHVVDLNQPVEQLVKSILRAVLRPAFRLRWSDIYILHDRDEAAKPAPGRGVAESAGVGAEPHKDRIPGELLKAFEHNYRSRRRCRWIKYAAISLTACLAIYGWYLTSGRYDQNSGMPPPAPSRPAAQQTAHTPVPQANKDLPALPAPATAAIVPKTPSGARR